MRTHTETVRFTVSKDDHLKVVQVGNSVRVIIHGEFGQEIVIEMQKAKYEEDMAPTWDLDDNITGLVEQIVQHLLHRKSYTEERTAELKSRYSIALLRNGSLWALKKEMVPAKAVADYIHKVIKAFEADEPGALAPENYIIALLRNPELCKIIMEA